VRLLRRVHVLPAGFLQDDVTAVTASHLPVRDDATFFLMWRFHQGFLDNAGHVRLSPAVWVKTATLWLREVIHGRQ